MKVLSLFCFFLFSTTRPVCYSIDDASSYADLHQFNLWRIKYNKTYEHKINLTDQFSAWYAFETNIFELSVVDLT